MSVGDFLAELFVKITPNFDNFTNEVNQGLGNAADTATDVGKRIGDSLGKGAEGASDVFKSTGQSLRTNFEGPIRDVGEQIEKLGSAFSVGLGFGAVAAVALAVGALYELGRRFDDAYDTIQIRTGETGATLEGLKDTFDDVFSDVPAKMGDVAEAIGLINSKLELQGPGLEALAEDVLNLQRLTGEDLAPTIEHLARVTNAWNLQGDESRELLNALFTLSREFGTSVGDLLGPLDQYGAKLRFLGLSAEEAGNFIGSLQKNGQDVGAIIEALTKAATGGGKDVAEAITDLEKAQEKYATSVERSEERVADARERQKELLSTLPDLREDNARRETDAANRVVEAEERLSQTRADAAQRDDEAQRTAAEASERSSQRVIDAETRLGEVVADQSEKVADAKDAQADAVEEGAERITAAELRLAEVQEQAGERVGRAQEAATERVADTRERAADQAERDAQRIADAEERLTDVIESGQDRIAAARDRQVEIAQRGNDRIADARARAVETAQRDNDRIADAEADLADAVEDATARFADAKADAADKAEEAADRILAAEAALQDVLETGAERRADVRERAQERIDTAVDREEEAQRRLAEAQAGADPVKIQRAQEALAKAHENVAKAQQKAARDVGKTDRDVATEVERAQQRIVAAKQASAKAAVEWAEKVAKAEIEGHEAVETAQGNLDKARATAATNAIASAQAVAAAERQAEADGIKAAKDIATAEQAAADDRAKAQEDVTEAKEQAARDADRAAKAVVEAERQGQRQVSDAYAQGLRDIKAAQQGVAQARDDAAEAAERANARVIEAERGQARAVADAGRAVQLARAEQTRQAEAAQRRIDEIHAAGVRSITQAETAKAQAIITLGQVQDENAERIADRIAQANKVISDAERKAADDTVKAKSDIAAAQADLDAALAAGGAGADVARQRIENLITAIKNAGTEQQALALAIDAGIRPAMAVTLVEAIRNGNLSLEDFRVNGLQPTTRSIRDMAAATDDVPDRFKNNFQRLLIDLEPIASGVFNWGNRILGFLLDNFPQVAGVAAAGIAAAIIGPIVAVPAAIATGLIVLGPTILEGLGNAWPVVADWGAKLPGRIGNAILSGAGALARVAPDLIGVFLGASLGLFLGPAGIAFAFFAGIPQRIANAIRSAASALVGVGREIVQWIGSGLAGAWDWLVNWLINELRKLPGRAASGLGAVLQGVGGFVTAPFRVPSLVTRDAGGPVTAGTSYLIGLNGLPEVFTPRQSGQIDTMNQWAGRGGSAAAAPITFQITLENVVMDSLERVEQLGRSLVRNAENSSLAQGRRVLPS